MKIYLVENRKNSAKERMTIRFFPDNYVKFVHLLKDERALFNKEVFNEIAENLAKKEVDGSDIALSIEGAFFKNRCGFFLADVCGVKDKHGVRFGMGYFYEISENMYNAVKAGKNLKTLIKEARSHLTDPYSAEKGVVDFITGHAHHRGEGVKYAISNAFDADYGALPKKMTVIRHAPTNNYRVLDKICKDELSKVTAL